MTCACGSGSDGCCSGTAPATPEVITNRPALSEVGYRAGRYATFRSSMLAALSGSAAGRLAALRTRDPADFSIALLDSWAVVLDILTFYSERVANEAFLRTAVEQRSVTEIAALIGYEPSPGVAASATLAFTLSTASGSPKSVVIPAGTRVQSVPGPGQKPQVFETSADLTALAAWNEFPAATSTAWKLSGREQSTWIEGTASHISVGDALLFVAAPGGAPSPSGPVEFHYVTAVSTDQVAKATHLTWEAPLSTAAFKDGVVINTLRKKAALFGANAPSPLTLPGVNVTYLTGWPGGPGNTTLQAGAHWTYQYGSGTSQVILDASYQGLAPAMGGPPQWLVLSGPSVHDLADFLDFTDTNPDDTLTAVFTITAAKDVNPGLYTLTSRATELTVANPQLLINGAPTTSGSSIDDFLKGYITLTPEVTAYVDTAQLAGAPLPLPGWGSLFVGPGVAGMLPPVQGTTITVVGGQTIVPGQPAGVSGKRVRFLVTPGSGATFVPAGASGGSKAADGQVFLLNAAQSTRDAAGDFSWSVITESGVAGTLMRPAGMPFPKMLPADKADPVVSEAVVVSAVMPSGDETELTLAASLSRIYDTTTVRVNANAVLATHGETVQEILGSGDASDTALSFTLKQAPLTYLTAPVTSGAQSTLQVWVNDLRWQEAPNLLAAGPADRVFTTSVDASGRVVVRFGDGVHGGRPPTGQANIRAVYRKGIGLAGMVSAGQISQPLDRPQGLSSATNPGPATGAADPATSDEIRASAPLPTTTIGRVVSLQDYQDYALGFAGIAKALATWTWTGSLRGVFLTVSGTDGAVLEPGDPVLKSLITALQRDGDPHVPLSVTSYQRVLFEFAAAVAVDTTYDPARVVTQAWQAVSAAFAFGERSIGQGVAASEIVEIIQGVAGVTAVRLTGLSRNDQPGTTGSVLRASGPAPPLGAELLILAPATQGQIGVWS
jgi:hypothetical protein